MELPTLPLVYSEFECRRGNLRYHFSTLYDKPFSYNANNHWDHKLLGFLSHNIRVVGGGLSLVVTFMFVISAIGK